MIVKKLGGRNDYQDFCNSIVDGCWDWDEKANGTMGKEGNYNGENKINKYCSECDDC